MPRRGRAIMNRLLVNKRAGLVKRIGMGFKPTELIVPGPRVTIEISREAADCLACWAKMQFYGPTISETITDQFQEWLNREHRDDTVEEYAGGDWDSLEEENKR